jgi:hypothetical protein
MTAVTIALLLVLLLWALAEAFSWPIVPDAALAAAVFMFPGIAIWGTLAVVIGSAIGGTAAITLYRRGNGWPMPMVTDRMRERVSHWLDSGPRGLIYQPLTAVPYKVFVVDAAQRNIAVATWALLTVVFRAPRMAAAAALATLGALGIERIVPPGILGSAKTVVLVAGIIVFLIGWRLAWRFWARSGSSPMAGDRARTVR